MRQTYTIEENPTFENGQKVVVNWEHLLGDSYAKNLPESVKIVGFSTKYIVTIWLVDAGTEKISEEYPYSVFGIPHTCIFKE